MADSLSICLDVIEILESNTVYGNKCPKCEPQLGKRGLYRALGGYPDPGTREMAMLWVLNLSDGNHSLLDIAEQSGMAYGDILQAARLLLDHGLLSKQ